MRPGGDRERVRRAAEILGVVPYLARYPRQLSGGQRQRVAMGRAIVRDPKVFLFDEPLSNLDAKLRVQMRAEIKELHQRLKTTTVYVTHDQVEAMTMADRIVVLNQASSNRSARRSSSTTARPTSSSRASSVAGHELHQGRHPRQRKAVIHDRRRHHAAADEGARRAAAAGDYGIGPEHLSLGGGVRRRSVIEPTGSETQVFARLGGQKIVGVFRERVEARPGARLPSRPIPPPSISSTPPPDSG